jgi:uncharacterized protein Yka (UPF0111/DUF47 family)
MFSLQKILGKDDKFFQLMEGSAEEARATVQCLVRMMKHPDKAPSSEPFAEVRKTGKRMSRELSEHLCKSFVTPLEREDIEALAHALLRIPKSVEKFGERFLLAPQHVKGWDLTKQMGMLEEAADTVVLMVKELRKGVNIETVQKQNDKLQAIEGEADNIMIKALDDLYNGDHSALRVVIQKDLSELLERTFDRCRDAGNIVFHIVLKHS